MAGAGGGAAWGSLVAGLASCATLPVAIYATRFSDSYDLLALGFAIPVAARSGSSRSRSPGAPWRAGRVSLSGGAGGGVATAGRVLGVIGLCLAASALVALGVYGLLEYVGSREQAQPSRSTRPRPSSSRIRIPCSRSCARRRRSSSTRSSTAGS